LLFPQRADEIANFPPLLRCSSGHHGSGLYQYNFASETGVNLLL
jgi:hypothetical protein